MVATSGTSNGKKWRLAPCLVDLFTESDRRFPNRSRASDGSLGDPAHAARVSDHNPDANGWVDAGDLTDDKASGCDADLLARHLVASRDPRVSYIIWNRTIVKSYGTDAWTPRVYTGTNPHDKHTHISVLDDARFIKAPWWPESEDDMSEVMDKLKELELRLIALDQKVSITNDRCTKIYDKIVPTETVKADIRLTRAIADKLDV